MGILLTEKKKYILEVEEDPTTIRLVKLKNGEDGLPCMQFVAVSPYKYDEAYQKGVHDTATEIEAIKDEAYNRGKKDAIDEIGCNEKEIATKACQSGLDEGKKMGMELMWEVIRKIILPSKRGGFTIDEFAECFGSDVSKYDVVEHFSASEAIEKIRQYEQEQGIQVGNEIKCDNERYVVLQKYLNNIDELMAVLFNRRDGEISVFHLYNGDGAIFEKTGKHFPEIVEVMRKMREE